MHLGSTAPTCSTAHRAAGVRPLASGPCTRLRRGAHLRTNGVAVVEAPTTPAAKLALDQAIREGHYEKELVQLQSSKRDPQQQALASILPKPDASALQDVVVVGCGPAGMYLAYQLALKGVKVALIGRDAPFVNNYGVWLDEFKDLGFEDTLDRSWPDALCYFGEGVEVKVRCWLAVIIYGLLVKYGKFSSPWRFFHVKQHIRLFSQANW